MPQQQAHCRTDMAFSMLCGSPVCLLAPQSEEGQSVPSHAGAGKGIFALPLLGRAAMHCHCSCSRLPQHGYCLRQSTS